MLRDLICGNLRALLLGIIEEQARSLGAYSSESTEGRFYICICFAGRQGEARCLSRNGLTLKFCRFLHDSCVTNGSTFSRPLAYIITRETQDPLSSTNWAD